MKIYFSTFVCVALVGCLSSNDTKNDEYIRKIKYDAKIEFPIDSSLPDSFVAAKYSLGLSNLNKGTRHKVEVTFESQENKFIENYSNESFAEDTNANFSWSILRKTKEQEGKRIQVILEINGVFIAKDTATYIKLKE